MAAGQRLGGLRRATATVRRTRGTAKWLLYSGIGIVGFFVILAIFAPLIAPYGFDQISADGVRFPKQASPSSEHLMGTTVQSTDVLSRVIWGARTAIEVVGDASTPSTGVLPSSNPVCGSSFFTPSGPPSQTASGPIAIEDEAPTPSASSVGLPVAGSIRVT